MDLSVKNLNVSYDNKKVIKNISFHIESGEIATIIGPNGSGKSTLIKAMGRCLKPECGSIYLGDKSINEISTKEVARQMAILPQMKNVSSDITVEELVSYGRFPHLKFGRKLSREDKEIIDWVIEKTGLKEMKKRFIITLSGGELQRAWIAMSLAQKPKIILLDEPTTYLDISFQLDVLELVKELNKTLGLTVIMVLHDLNQAARYSDKIVVINNGELCGFGIPQEVINKSLLRDIFSIDVDIYTDNVNKCPFFIPKKPCSMIHRK